jgi:steroid delta-isomerase-like uncharacterized protein
LFALGDECRRRIRMYADEFVRRYLDAINRGDVPGLGALYASDAVLYDPLAPEPVRGREAIQATFAAFKQAIPDLRWELIAPVVGDGQRVTFEVKVSGVNSGLLAMPQGELPPTGSAVSFTMAIAETLDEDGLIAEERSYFDATGFAAQLGIAG